MSPLQFIKQNLIYFWKKNLFLSIGIAISAAVITGSLIVGDSMRSSLQKVVDKRLGTITHVLNTGDRYVSSSLAASLSENFQVLAAPVLQTRGMAIADGGTFRIENIQIYGIDSVFDVMAKTDTFYSALAPGEIIISENLSQRLQADAGDEILFRIEKASMIPLNAPFVSDANNIVPERFTIKAVATDNQLGRFNLKKSQTAPFNAFIQLDELSSLMDLNPKANLILFSSANENTPREVYQAVKAHWSIEDMALNAKKIPAQEEIRISSERVFIDSAVAEKIMGLEGFVNPVLTYFVNSLSANGKRTPYSFVSGLMDKNLAGDEIRINTWLAEDLGVRTGDTIIIEYFVVGPLRELETANKKFVISEIVPMEGRYADQTLMPDIPGLSDAGNCRDWETGVPVDLNSIRDKDENYWNKWKGTPKAFISIETAKKLWGNRFGSYTGFRFSSHKTNLSQIKENLVKEVNPEELGFQFTAVKTQGEMAARNGVDFSQLFAGLSFFLLAGGVILTILLFLLNLEDRKPHLKTLHALGIAEKTIMKLVLGEGMIVAFAGSIIGTILAVFYTYGVFSALNGIWHEIVRTDVLQIKIIPTTLLVGMGITLLLSSVFLYFPLKKFLRNNLAQKKRSTHKRNKGNLKTIMAAISIITGIAGIILTVFQIVSGASLNESLFFIAGGLLLISGISGFYQFLLKPVQQGQPARSIYRLSQKSMYRNPVRSLSIVMLFSLGAFLVVSTGSNRKDLFKNADDRSSGTGGFLYYAETTVPVLKNLNKPELRYEYGLTHDYSFLQLRVAEGDDASCLNLNRITNPAILGIPADSLEGRFRFVTKTPYLDLKNPWLSLKDELPGGLIPAIADETVIKWGLGLSVGDTLSYLNSKGNQLNLLLIGGLAPSIFQGKVLIANHHFLKAFPESSGTEVFLIDGSLEDTAWINQETKQAFRDFGWQMTRASERLAEFNSVNNTYLSIFMILGALGLLLGTIGLGIVLFKSILERKQEFALMRAVGIGFHNIRNLIVFEYLMLLAAGIIIGFVSSIVATLPSFLNPGAEANLKLVLIIFILLLANGVFWTYFLAQRGLQIKSIYKSLRNE